MAGARALDIPLRQCLVNYDEDENGLFWHQRILVSRGPNLQWIWVTPTRSVQLGDLSDLNIFPLQRNKPLPPHLLGQIFGFAPLTEEELRDLMAQAKELAEIYGFDLSCFTTVGGGTFMILDVRSQHYGETVPPEQVMSGDGEAFILRGAVALAKVDGHWLQAVRIDSQDISQLPVVQGSPPNVTSWDFFRRLSSGDGIRDCRMLGDDRDSRGARFLDFRSMLLRSKQVDQVGFPLKGPHVAPEMAVALRDAGQEGFEIHHSHWAAKSGVPERSAAVRDHRLWSQVLRMGISFDLLDPANCASLEFAARRLAQIETAVKRNPKVPDYDGLDAMLETTIDSTGAAVAPAFGSWFAELRKTQAVVMKADRQFREEQTALQKDKNKKNDGGG